MRTYTPTLHLVFALGAIISASLISIQGAQAIQIDKLIAAQDLSVSGAGDQDSSLITSVSAIGGTRSIETTSLAAGRTDVYVESGRFSHNEAATGQAITRITWDGDNIVGPSNFSGLGGIDLTKDGATAFLLYLDYRFYYQMLLVLLYLLNTLSLPNHNYSLFVYKTILKSRLLVLHFYSFLKFQYYLNRLKVIF